MAAEICRLIGSPRLKVLYDIIICRLNEGCICDTITNYGDQFGHIHVADAPGRHEPGTGEINYKTQLMYLMAHICINDKRFLSAGFIINFQNDYLSVWKNYFCNFYNANCKIVWK